MFKNLLISLFLLIIAHSAFSNSQEEIQKLEEFLDQTDIKFMSESDAEEFNFLTVEVDDKFSIKADLGAVAKASIALRNAVNRDIGRKKEAKDNHDNKSYQLKLAQLSYSANAVKLLRLIVKKEFIPYSEDIIKRYPDIMEELLSIMESYGIDGLSYVIANACKSDYFCPSSAKFAELLLHSNPDSLIIKSLMESICWASLSKSSKNVSLDAEELFKNFVVTNFKDLCTRFSFFQLVLSAFSVESRVDTLVRRVVNRYK
ncbi:MAG: hypothetical protein AB8G05_17180 [Oligoflexales bacterium]